MSSSDDPLDVLIITVNEFYYIPKFLTDVLASDDVNIIGITTTPPSLGTERMPRFIYRLYSTFGPRIFLKHCLFYGKYRFLDFINRASNHGEAYSPQTLAVRHNITYRHVADINSSEYKQYVSTLSPDVIASVAATQKFDTELLAFPQQATINIHSSLLPEYRGVSPNFWVLLNDEDVTGITVHYMDEELDTGDVICQEQMDIHGSDTLHSLNTRTAEQGSELLMAALHDIKQETVSTRPIDPDDGAYYSLPGRDDVRMFLKKGNKFY